MSENEDIKRLMRSLKGPDTHKVVKVVEGRTSDEATFRANVFAKDGWVIKHVLMIAGGWFRKERWFIEMYKEVEIPPDAPNVSLSLNVGPVTQRS